MQNAELRLTEAVGEMFSPPPLVRREDPAFVILNPPCFVILNAVKNLKILRFAQDDIYKYVIT